jgi:hypothetical protein
MKAAVVWAIFSHESYQKYLVCISGKTDLVQMYKNKL